MARWAKKQDDGRDPLPPIPGRESLFERVAAHEETCGSSFSVLWISEKDVGKACKDLWASIPTRRNSDEPSFHTDIATALGRGGIRISKTTIKVKQ